MTTTHDAAAPATAPAGYELRQVDPASLLDNPSNVRRAGRDREGLAASINALGILEPPLVYEMDDGSLAIIAGERRKYSAIKAGLATIPVFVRNDMDGVRQVAGMLVENRDRDNLTPFEEAVAVQQLAGFDGVTQRDIAAMTGMKPDQVRSALTVAASDVATAVGERHDLTLDQLLVLAEFDQDKEAVKQLTVTAVNDPARFAHLAAHLRRQRDDRDAYDAVAAAITAAAGVRLIEPEDGSWLPEDAVWLVHLPPPKGRKSMTEAAHRSCPGHAASVVETDDGYEAEYLCLDPVSCGHAWPGEGIDPAGTVSGSATAGEQPSKGMTDEQKAERRKVIANNKAWEVASPVRREYVTHLLARRTAPKGTLRYVAEAILADPRSVAEGDGAAVVTLAGKASAGDHMGRAAALALAADATDARLPLVLAAQVAASVEARSGERQGWRAPTPALRAYLRFLASTGYGLSEVEQEVVGDDESEATDEAA